MHFLLDFYFLFVMFACVLWLCRRSSVVEHTLGKGGVESPILFGGTILRKALEGVPFVVDRVESQKVRLFRFRKRQFFNNYRTFGVKAYKNKRFRKSDPSPIKFNINNLSNEHF